MVVAQKWFIVYPKDEEQGEDENLGGNEILEMRNGMWLAAEKRERDENVIVNLILGDNVTQMEG